jgi:hypothetical protein
MLQCTYRHTGHNNLQYNTTVPKSNSLSFRKTVRDVVFRDIKTTTVTQMRDVHIRDKIIKDCILLGSSLTVGMFSSRIVSCLHPLRLSIQAEQGCHAVQKAPNPFSSCP